ncbi:hypothetical protein AZI86_16770 [Bdellovibrio bacteriovorus]|uniref:Uncharacterized protein n=1 Tax=Bdellovibrio bacteriovorus TaxID=959 RepID=A0A150WHC8_BDEBC|nr:hypothetical protein [Bdellovibrio bacteriovorus]KYG62485.1 hypothetical protein AZI86_16770 [Bdellovibrio bacteriovorus]
MPQTKEYKGKKGSSSSSKRRPRHEMADKLNDEAVDAVSSEEAVYDGAEAETEAEAINTEALNEGVFPEGHSQVYVAPDDTSEETAAEKTYESFHQKQEEPQKVHLEFYGSDLIRMKAPKVMELADTVADEWVKDGEFQGLPVGNPFAQLAASKALRKAKDVEKKLEEKGVFMMARMGLDYLKSKIDKK